MDVLSTKILDTEERSIFVPILRSVHNPISALKFIHQHYGDLVSARFFKQKMLFVCLPNHIEEVYAQEARGLMSRDFLYDAKKTLFRNGLVNSKAEVWTPQRRLMQPLFTKDSIIEWEQVFVEEARSFTEKLHTTASGTVNISYQLKQLIQRIFVQVLIGRSVDHVTNSEDLIQAIDTISKGLLSQLVSQIISNGKLMWLMPIKSRRYHNAVNLLSDFIKYEIEQNQGTDTHSLIRQMAKARDKKTGYAMTQSLLVDESINLFFAGQDTTLNTLAWFFYLIGKDERVHRKVTDEILKYKDSPLNAVHLENLTYTKAVLYETLRLYPPTSALAEQAVEDVVIGGRTIKKGTIIILSMFVTHRHEKLWKKPNKFYPEHFLNEQWLVDRHKYAFFPFGGGLHNCIGRHFAELEMLIIIVTLLRNFMVKTSDNIKMASSITLKPKKDIMVAIRPSSDQQTK